MTGYMYNPSKKVTEVLSQYLEFDPKQIQVAIWSGHLSLTDVKLKHDAFYDIINDFLATVQQQPSTTPTTGVASATTTPSTDHAKPPLRCKILSATMGSLEMKIPWKRLVWGQTDVKVHVKNLNIAIAFESHDEAAEVRRRRRREAKATKGGKGNNDDDDSDTEDELYEFSPTAKMSRKVSSGVFFPDDAKLVHHRTNERGETTESVLRTEHLELVRALKQARLREAERRLLQGLPFASWMASARKRDNERIVKIIASAEAEMEEKKVKHVSRWFKTAMNDFFWRFYVGLDMSIENMKITIVQDGIEVGVVLPSVSTNSDHVAPKEPPLHRQKTDSELEDKVDSSSLPDNVVYKGEHDDGEYVDKRVKILGFGIYIRKIPGSQYTATPESVRFGGEVTTKEYLLRPVDVSFSYSMFFPYPPDKRKRRRPVDPAVEDVTATTVADTVLEITSPSVSSSKRRRGKLEKMPLERAASNASHGSAGPNSSRDGARTNPQSSGRNRTRRLSMVATSLPAYQRRASISVGNLVSSSNGSVVNNAGNVDGSGAPSNSVPTTPLTASTDTASTGIVPSNHSRRQSIMFRSSAVRPVAKQRHQHIIGNGSEVGSVQAPLVQPDNISSAYLAATRTNKNLTAHLDVDVSIGSVEFVCSTGHYKLFNMFLAASARMRNGRPNVSILGGSSIRQHSSRKQRGSLSERTAIVTSFESDSRHHHNSSLSERQAVVRSWWRYALRAVIWELRQRENLRMKFLEKYLHFSWEHQRYKRSEYVKLFIMLKLDCRGSELFTSTESQQENLLKIEDELCIEHILLYRSLARAIYVRGGKEMPKSICGIRDGNLGEELKDEEGSVPAKSTAGRSTEMRSSTEVMPTFLSKLTELGETARARYNAEIGQYLPCYDPVAALNVVSTGQRSLFGESTLGGATLSAKSTKSSNTFELEKLTENELTEDSLMTSLKIEVEKLEVSIVEEEFFDYVTEHNQAINRRSFVQSDATSSDVSVLTDDQRFFEDQDCDVATCDLESFEPGPILSSTDYLLFKTPENILLKFEVVPLNVSMHSQNGVSRSVKLEIGRIDAVGDKKTPLLSIGGVDSKNLAKERNNNFDSFDIQHIEKRRYKQSVPEKALSTSLVVSRVGTILQWDMSALRIWIDIETSHKIFEFWNKAFLQYPQQLLIKSVTEDVRLFLLGQNASATINTLNSSIRIHGMEISILESKTVPKETPLHHGPNTTNNNEEESIASAVLRSGLIEVYSGSAVIALEANNMTGSNFSVGSNPTNAARPATRALRMLNVTERTMSRSSILSNHWVITTNGIDLLVKPDKSQNNDFSSGQLSLFEEPIDIELLWTVNLNSIDDFNRAKQEWFIETSKVYFLFTRERTEILSQIFLSISESLSQKQRLTFSGVVLPPRLEVLSSFLINSVQLHVEKFRISFSYRDDHRHSDYSVSDPAICRIKKHEDMSDSIRFFLKVATSFDLSFPHEEALASAMQICIDQLTGIGLSLEDAWEVANTSLLNFLDDADFISTKLPHETKSSIKGLKLLDEDSCHIEDPFHNALENSVTKTLDMFAELLEHCDESSNASNDYLMQDDFVFDVPDGLTFSLVELFYDSFMNVFIPTMFLTDCAGLHLLRINPTGNNEKIGAEIPGVMSTASDENVRDDDSYQPLVESGISLRIFNVDKQHSFGKGGLSLSAVGTNSMGAATSMIRTRERYIDLDSGEIEFIFSAGTFEEFVSCLTYIFEPVNEDQAARQEQNHLSVEEQDTELFILVSCASISALFLADDLTPFTRLVFGDNTLRTQNIAHNSSHLKHKVVCICARALSLINLTREGELYPTVVVKKSDFAMGVSLVAKLLVTVQGTELDICFEGMRLVFLNQFVEECLQYFATNKYGFGRFLNHLVKTNEENDVERDASTDAASKSKFRWKISMTESSIIMPRSTVSLDMIGWEMESLKIEHMLVSESFRLPTESTPLHISELFGDLDENEEKHDKHESGNVASKKMPRRISRLVLQLRGLRLFSSLPTGLTTENIVSIASFRHFFIIDGCAEKNKPVYKRRSVSGAIDMAPELDEMKIYRRWEEITVASQSLDIIADRLSHLRLLITHPIGLGDHRFEIDVNQSQFCLLLSMWFSNLHELPVMFPYSGAELEKMSRSPSFGFNFPEFGTDSFNTLLRASTEYASELSLCLNTLSFRLRTENNVCDHALREKELALIMELSNATIHVTNDTLGITRIGCGSTGAIIVDESKKFQRVLEAESLVAKHSFANLFFGLESSSQTSCNGSSLQQTFELGVIMTPSWSLYRLGTVAAHVCLQDFSSIFKFLEFVSKYFSDPLFENPNIDAAQQADDLKRHLNAEDEPLEQLYDGLTFQLLLKNPTFIVPCESESGNSPGIRMNCDYLLYKYTAVDSHASQEVWSNGFGLIFDDVCIFHNSVAQDVERRLIEFLSFGIKIYQNYETHHTDVTLQLPLDDEVCSFQVPSISVPPPIVGPAQVCIPYDQPRRFLGCAVCEITLMIDLLPSIYAALSKLFSNVTTEESVSSVGSISSACESGSSIESDDCVHTLSLTAAIANIRIFALDPVLGAHLPVAVLSISSVTCSLSQLSLAASHHEDPIPGESPPEDFQVFVEAHFWADYFKLGQTRSWEPLLEAYKVVAWYERSRFRGSGIFFRSDTPFHVNISGALLVIIDEVIDSFRRIFRYTFFSERGEVSAKDKFFTYKGYKCIGERRNVEIADSIDSNNVLHVMPDPVRTDDRVAFSVCNMTGQDIRLCRPQGLESNLTVHNPTVVSYVGHLESVQLDFCPSISMVKNMAVIEVDYPGLPNSNRSSNKNLSASLQTINLQIPGFRWIKGVEVSTFGRNFANIVPRSKELRLKAKSDWKLSNLFKVLVEVGLQNGGRQVSIRSLFSIVNKTSHTIGLLLHPDPHFEIKSVIGNTIADPLGCTDAELAPGDLYQIPILLNEYALLQSESHIGSFWLRPTFGSSSDLKTFESFLGTPEEVSELSIDFSAKPVQLVKILNESEALFGARIGTAVAQDDAKTGIQISCPIMQGKTERLSPFCYTIEIARSPLVAASHSSTDREKDKNFERSHGPVAYSLSIHPPFLIVNMLPAKGRFELMHAVRRTVLWYADLDPGQQVSVHSVGLDAPLLLLLNLGFCRTPVGEGALVHHGSETSRGARAEGLVGLKSIGKAGKAVTKHLGKTLTKIGDSPEQRGLENLALLENPQLFFNTTKKKVPRRPRTIKKNIGLDSGVQDIGGKTYRVDTAVFFPQDVAAETTVVDGIGQRLTLNIENVCGGGGQRRISVFCPFWIVNTTEHCLRYKQDGIKSFVSGTVTSPAKDGSIPLSGGRAQVNYDSRHLSNVPEYDHLANKGTIFSGTPGALATSPGCCDRKSQEVLSLIESNLSIEHLSKIAFMFNFSEGVLSIGHLKICVQLWDGTGATRYSSDWSAGFSLESVGFSHVVAMHCKDGRALEVTAVVNVAPGLLSGYTKIVRFLPRYVAINCLPYPIRLWQDSSIFRPSSTDSLTFTPSKDRKWRLVRGSVKKSINKINQYESLFGRETVLDERKVLNNPSGTRAHPSALYVTTIGRAEIVPFNLPDSRGERQLRVCLGGLWNLTSSISADVPGEHALKITRATDLKVIPHISTRASPEYEVLFTVRDLSTSGRELGVWFETEWGSDKSLIVKAVKKDSFAFQETDIHVGDELMLIDDALISTMTFVEAMNKLRRRLSEIAETAASVDPRISQRRGSMRLVSRPRPINQFQGVAAPPLKLTFRTVEERLRQVRLQAARANDIQSSSVDASLIDDPPTLATIEEDGFDLINEPSHINVELKALQHSLFLVLQEKKSVPYQIQNRTCSHTLYYRQKGCDGHPWNSLKPGQFGEYCWEEPLKAKRLIVRVAIYGLTTFDDVSVDRYCESNEFTGKRSDQKLSRVLSRKIKDEEESVFSPTVTIRLEEIGFRGFLSCPAPGEVACDTSGLQLIELQVDVVGITRVLVVQDAARTNEESQVSQYFRLSKQLFEAEQTRGSKLHQIKNVLDDYDVSAEKIENDASMIMKDFPEKPVIHKCNQIMVQILEAKGLSPDSYVGFCNPYAEVTLKSNSSRRRIFFKKIDLYRTYYVEKAVNPSWISQTFVFNVPEEAVSAPRGHSVKVRLRNHRVLGYHKVLGSTHIEFHSFRDQKQLVGWFPLAGKTGRHELENPLSHWGRGSIRLQIQWIHNLSGLINYFIQLSERRLLDLEDSLDGLRKQLEYKKVAESKKREAVDGFKRVRVRDLVSLSAQGKKHIPLPFIKGEVEASDNSNSSVAFDDIHRADMMGNDFRQITIGSDVLRKDNRRFTFSTRAAGETRERLHDLISKKRQSMHTLRGPSESKLSILLKPGVSASFPISSLRTLTAAKCLFRDTNLVTLVEGEDVKLRLKHFSRNIMITDKDETSCIVQNFSLPRSVPLSIRTIAINRGKDFQMARNAFERAARRETGSILHPGGWLIVRPYAALNLPDTYTGMFVRLRYGPDIVDTEIVDARLSPTWNVPRSHRRGIVSLMDNEIEQKQGISNDLHIHVAPQQTSSSIRLSVIGEKSNRNLQAKTELGVVYLPLGATIAACMDSTSSSNSAPDMTMPSPFLYEKWFLLTDPKLVIPVEGDRGVSLRSPESEKDSDVLFKEYFAPCIHVALIWLPDIEESSGTDIENDKDAYNGTLSMTHNVDSLIDGPLMTTYLRADVGSISIALIDSQRAFELVSLSVSDIHLRYWTTKAKTRFGVSLGWLQVDQQDDNAREPVMVAPTPSDYLGPVVQMLAVKDNVRSADGVLSFDFFDVSVAEFDITLEESMLFDLFDFITSVKLRRGFLVRAASARSTSETLVRTGIETINLFQVENANSVLETLETQIYQNNTNGTKDKMVYIEQLFLGVLKVNLSYLKGKKQTWELTNQGNWVAKKIDGTHGLSQLGSSSGLFTWSSPFHIESVIMTQWSQHTSDDEYQFDDTRKGSQSLPQFFASLFPNISDAPIRLQGKALNHIFESPREIIQSIKKFYVNETLKQLYRIIGSLDLVGNPTMLITSFFSGVRDLVVTPSRAFMSSPTNASGVGLGVAKGALSLISHTTSGFFGSWAKFSATAGQLLTWVVLDPDYRTWHRDKIVTEATNLNREWKRRGVQSVQAMLTRPIWDLLFGIAGGVGSIFLSPIKGYSRGGRFGLVQGLAGGIIGVVIKPVVGVCDASAHFAASVFDIAKSVNVLDKRRQPALKLRLPYTFGLMNTLLPFDSAAARAVLLLKRYKLKRSLHSLLKQPETLVHVEVLPNIADTYMIATSARVLLIRLRKETSGSLTPSLCWEAAFCGEATISSIISEYGHNGVALTLTVANRGAAEHTNLAVEHPSSDDLEMLSDQDDYGNDEHENVFRYLGDALRDQYHGTGRGEQGELLEWFTVVAEYQYRPQLVRMHNVVSCLAGKIKEVIQDPSIGRPGSTEGYTSFRNFTFSSTDDYDNARDSELTTLVERLPWVHKSTFETLRDVPFCERQEQFERDKEIWSPSRKTKPLNSKEKPDWFVDAFATACHIGMDDFRTSVEKDRPTQFDVDEDVNSGSRPKKKRWGLPTIPDGGVLEAAFRFRPRFNRSSSIEQVGLESSPAFPVTNEPDVEEVGQKSKKLATRRQKVSNLDRLSRNSLNRSSETLSSLQSEAGHLRAASANDDSALLSSDNLSTVYFSVPNEFNTIGSGCSNISLEETPTVLQRTGLIKPPVFSHGAMTNDDASANDGNYDDLNTSKSKPQRPTRHLDRLDRLEALMEQLIILTSENVLRDHKPYKVEDKFTLIHQDNANVREQAQYQPQSAAIIEVSELRSELASLKAQMIASKIPLQKGCIDEHASSQDRQHTTLEDVITDDNAHVNSANLFKLDPSKRILPTDYNSLPVAGSMDKKTHLITGSRGIASSLPTKDEIPNITSPLAIQPPFGAPSNQPLFITNRAKLDLQEKSNLSFPDDKDLFASAAFCVNDSSSAETID